MKIEVKDSSIIHPAKDTPKHPLWISNLDLMVARIHILTVYFYKPNDSLNFFSPEVLKEALSDVLVPFYPVAGRLGKDENGRYEIQCNGEGVLFVEAQTDSTIDDEFGGDFTPCLEFQKLIPTIDYSAHFSSYPLLVLQVTFFKCGGVCLGVGFHHTLGDGFSALDFINTWSDVARGLSITISPFTDRTILRARDPPTPKFHHIEFDPSPSMNILVETPKYQSDLNPPSVIVLKITVDQLNTLKAQAKKDKSPTRYSTFETLAAHLWRCACTAYGLSDDQATKLFTITNGRSRLNPPLPAGYLGNVIFPATSIGLANDVRSRPLANTAQIIHKALVRMDDDYMRSALDFLELQPDPTAFVRGSHTFRCPNFSVTSWITLPVYDADFGWGRPIYMGPAKAMFEGNTYILPSPKKGGNLSVVICLETHHMEVFRKKFYEF